MVFVRAETEQRFMGGDKITSQISGDLYRYTKRINLVMSNQFFWNVFLVYEVDVFKTNHIMINPFYKIFTS